MEIIRRSFGGSLADAEFIWTLLTRTPSSVLPDDHRTYKCFTNTNQNVNKYMQQVRKYEVIKLLTRTLPFVFVYPPFLMFSYLQL